ncbi:FAD-binding protein [Pseudoprevotella muciniphila]|uniref:FAD-binding protein n=1 Tax=Pseudoprevotella muciniphila TaxID=2133944 RepID=A0A5P8E7V4_9BACT|nr:FAD-dependent monooxygenase [Pseudoprevotella muciniphila]QFQ13105.1 FAD-binding protein [Pseudoprevotella muciniphila]
MISLRLPPEIAYTPSRLKAACADEMGVDVASIKDVRILRRSIDARQRQIFVNLSLEVFIDEPAPELYFAPIVYPDVNGKPAVIVVGAGPGGLFAALRLIELGLRPIVLERGKDVHERRKDIALISREHTVNSESNYSFGEGGAGAFSDGKLYTRSKKRGNVEKILRVFCQHGASTDILCDAHPHIGTDKLPRIIERMREQIIAAGGEVHFQTRADALIIEKQEVRGVVASDGRAYEGPVILATGHSARDVYQMLHRSQVAIEAKGLAVGVRLEHPSHLIDQIQYHSREGRGKYLPAAEYSFVAQCTGAVQQKAKKRGASVQKGGGVSRGVYSFCMCPGGFVVPAASGAEQLVVNGMSPSNRGSAWSNSGMVVELHPEDIDNNFSELFANCEMEVPATDDPLRMMHLQSALERMTWQQGGCKQTAPAQRMYDFLNGRLSGELPATSYAPGVIASPLHFWMPGFIVTRLQEGFRIFGQRSKGFLTNEAVLIASETRTSSPVRILRDQDSLQSPHLQGLFPCGEGAGYAGGIVSSAIDGERCAEAVAQMLAREK